jgi:hypothetical protein
MPSIIDFLGFNPLRDHKRMTRVESKSVTLPAFSVPGTPALASPATSGLNGMSPADKAQRLGQLREDILKYALKPGIENALLVKFPLPGVKPTDVASAASWPCFQADEIRIRVAKTVGTGAVDIHVQKGPHIALSHERAMILVDGEPMTASNQGAVLRILQVASWGAARAN